MKFWIFFLIYLTSPCSLLAQQPDQTIARVSYAFSHIRDTMDRNHPYKENMLLILGKNASLYTSADKIEQIQRLTDFAKAQIKANGGTLNNIVMQKGLIKPVSKADFYFFSDTQKSITVESVMTTKYRVDEQPTTISWKISKDTLSFNGIHCQKATAYFKGRNWIAWFAPELPFATGPWKLNSLPGLIIEAYDERKEVQFSFAGLENVQDKIPEVKEEVITIGTANMLTERKTYFGKDIEIPSNALKTTRAEMDRLKLALADNPAAAISSQSVGATTVKRISGPSTPIIKRNTYNNPIELPEIKK